MVQLRINGRAGNQLFQYATVYAYLKEKNKKEMIYISFEDLEKRKTDNTTFNDTLKDFNVDMYETIQHVNMTKKQKILDFLYRVTLKIIRNYKKIIRSRLTEKDYKIINKIWHKTLNKNGLYYYIPTDVTFYESETDNIIFFGAFENEEYFNKYNNEIKHLFTPIEKEKKENKKLYRKIKDENSVCVTIRRGDFLIDKFKKNFYICTPEYFKKAINKMNDLVDNPQYIVFSDDVEWCKKNMSFPKNTLYESGNDEIWEKLRLMYSCKNFIISNSTFSWWSQYLSENEKKIVIAPKLWNNFEYSEKIYSKDWILL